MELTLATWSHIIGTGGAALLLFAYFLVSKGKVDGKSKFYQLLNVVGSAMLAVNTGFFTAWPSFGLNIIWIFIGVTALGRIAVDRKKGDAASKKAST